MKNFIKKNLASDGIFWVVIDQRENFAMYEYVCFEKTKNVKRKNQPQTKHYTLICII